MLPLAFILAVSSVGASELVWQFHNPSFSGIGYSSHVMTVYNQELSRKLAIATEKKAAELKAENDAKNTPMAKFVANLESRVYNELARQITDKLFEGVGNQVTGNFAFNGGNISYISDSQTITLTITDDAGNITNVSVPIGDFGWMAP